MDRRKINQLDRLKVHGYKRIKVLGKGASSEVYEARNERHPSQRVAIKTLHQSLIREAHIHKRLHHNNIVAVQKLIEDIHQVYLVLELCQGGTLKQYL